MPWALQFCKSPDMPGSVHAAPSGQDRQRRKEGEKRQGTGGRT